MLFWFGFVGYFSADIITYHPISQEHFRGSVHVPWTHPVPPESQIGSGQGLLMFINVSLSGSFQPIRQIGVPSESHWYVIAF
jgi:hypothetical protein